MTSRHIGYQDIISAYSLDHLVQIYSERGHSFKDEKDFLRNLDKNWNSESRRIFESQPETIIKVDRLPSVDVVVDGAVCNIYGIIHNDFRFSNKYFNIVRDTIESQPNLLFEQNVGKFLFPFVNPTSGIEVPDHRLRSNFDEAGSFFMSGIRQSLMAQLRVISLPFYLTAQVTGAWKYIAPIVQRINERQKQIKRDKTSKHNLKISLYSTKIANLTLRGEYPVLNSKFEGISYEKNRYTLYPTYISLELAQRPSKPRYVDCAKRSAYLAEFLRAWKPGEDKSMVVGSGHVMEIKYFLEQGVKDARITDLANQHLDILTSDADKYKRLMRQPFNKVILNQLFFYTGFLMPITAAIGGMYQL